MADLPVTAVALASAGNVLDIAPMISALQRQPMDFEYQDGWLRHVPSRHCLKFSSNGHVTIDAQCGCARQSIKQAQGVELYQAFMQWYGSYWRPTEIDREFAAHFRPTNAWVRLFRDLRTAWRRFRRDRKQATSRESAAAVAAE
jgi:hypothetical protein